MSEIVLTEEQREVLRGKLQEAVNSKYRAQAEKDLQKEIATSVKEDLEIKPALFNKLAKLAYEDSARKLNDEVTEILDLAEEMGFYSHNENEATDSV